MKKISKSIRNAIIGTTLSFQATTASATGWPVADIQEFFQVLQSVLQQAQIQLNTYNQYLTMFNIEKLTEGTTAGMIADIIQNGFGGMEDKLVENFTFLDPANQYKDMFENMDVNKESFETFEKARETLIEGFFTDSEKSEDAEKLRRTREKAYVNSLINAQAVSTAHKNKIASFKDELENLQQTVSQADGVLPANLAQCAILLKLYEAQVSQLALSASNLELKSTEALNRDFRSDTVFPEEK